VNTPCQHVGQIEDVTPLTHGCEACLQTCDTWVRLRMCMSCGHIGCCDDSKNKHAAQHFHASGHAIIKSFEPSETWMWCYVDQVVVSSSVEQTESSLLEATKDFLRRLPLFADLSEEDLERIYGLSQSDSVAAGQALMHEGEEGDALYIIQDGDFEVTKQSSGQEVVLAVRRTGEVIGEMSLLAKEPRAATVTALRDSHVLTISQAAFKQLLACSPAAGLDILHTMAVRLRSTEALVSQHEKMAGLGRLSAGLAHELNNPAAAVRRSSMQLAEMLTEWQRLSSRLDALAAGGAQIEKVRILREEMAERPTSVVTLDPLTQSDRESELQDWLDERNIDESWELAPVLVNLGRGVEWLEELSSGFDAGHLAVLVPWFVKGASAYSLLNEVRASAEQISHIVTAVKSYSYLDQAPVQQVDVHEGLENTLIILKHKLKVGVQVNREYGANLPRIEAYASELNQVWTNLIDNAIDAMDGSGEITLRTSARGTSSIVVEICDNGPGIQPEIQDRVFQPFFTTKPQGVGTGLGLHIVYNIIVDKHHGRVDVESQPGMTCFKVSLPVELVRA
jgi:signal transduction histidine kinase